MVDTLPENKFSVLLQRLKEQVDGENVGGHTEPERFLDDFYLCFRFLAALGLHRCSDFL